ncbi:HEPN-associated N-terminal domain-containing protein [Acinetobacter sp.]|uniref:HEPN-associated N-terminal domain-containing protein n=1 Tax=Acinetobacter sp. TaxID=472 RepID=UPI0035ADC881
MGYWSDYQIQMHEKPALLSINKTICSDCVKDEFLSNLVIQNLCSNRCSYCLNTSENMIATNYDVVMQQVYKAILLQYQDAQNSNMPYVEKGWLFDQIYVEDIFFDFDPGWSNELLNDLISSADPSWYLVSCIEGDWATLSEHDVLLYGWENFKEQVLYKTRYLFLNQKGSNQYQEIPVASMLNELARLCTDLKLVKEIPEGTVFFRVRSHSDAEPFKTFNDVGVAPRGIASAGRMNPAGISYFYVAYDEATATNEVITDQDHWSIAKFRLKQKISVIDFSNIPILPSQFDVNAFKLREKIHFLHDFVDDLSQPVQKDGREHIDYVPTQIISEFFRYGFEPKIKGIKYQSIKHKDGLNIAFFESDNVELEKLFELVCITGN